MAQAEKQDPLEKPIALWRGFRGVCPGCGKGRLFKSYLVQAEACSACGEDFSDIHADDGPAWFVMVLTGAMVVPAAVALSLHDVMPEWAAITTLLILAVAVTLLLLPRAKGLFIAILWRLKRDKATAPRPGP